VTRGIADTSLFISREAGRSIDEAAVPDEIAVSVVTIGELRAGVLVAGDVVARSRRLATLNDALSLRSLPVDDDVADAWARLRVLLRDARQRMPVNDSWIAATAMVFGVPVITQDADYDDVPGLDVVRI
jgi:hypothetical protein